MNDKIKHLLATAYKTDSIEKNKWRIENREQLREKRKKELKELMEKDNEMNNNKQQPQPENPKNQFSNTEPLTHAQRVAIAKTMSNNKQSSVDWLLSFIEPSLTQEQKHFFSMVIEQAKAMHHNEVVYFVEDWYCNGPLLGGGVNLVETIEKHYNETFGGNND